MPIRWTAINDQIVSIPSLKRLRAARPVLSSLEPPSFLVSQELTTFDSCIASLEDFGDPGNHR